MVSIFILPINDYKLLNLLMNDVNKNTRFHFALEKLVLKNNEILNWAYNYVKYRRVIKNF